jgi:hypothetical protein
VDFNEDRAMFNIFANPSGTQYQDAEPTLQLKVTDIATMN